MKTKVDVLVTVEVTHEEDALMSFIYKQALQAVGKNCVRGCDKQYGIYAAIALDRVVLNNEGKEPKSLITESIEALFKSVDKQEDSILSVLTILDTLTKRLIQLEKEVALLSIKRE